MNSVPRWFTIVAALALLWNLLGCFAIASDLMLTPQDIAAMPAAQRALYEARPGWSVAGSVLAVAAGALGSLGLLLRRKWAHPLLIASLVGVLVQDAGLFGMTRAAAEGGAPVVIMQGLVLLIAVLLVVLSRKAMVRGWLR